MLIAGRGFNDDDSVIPDAPDRLGALHTLVFDRLQNLLRLRSAKDHGESSVWLELQIAPGVDIEAGTVLGLLIEAILDVVHLAGVEPIEADVRSSP